MNFDSPNFKDLDGGKEDEQELHVLFGLLLGFDIKVHQNLKAEEIHSTVEGYSRKDHKGRPFILIILSHGGEGDVVYGTDGVEVGVHQLQRLFYSTNCPSLAGVPKVFFIDACRGEQSEGIYKPQQATPKSTSMVNKNGGSASSTDSVDFAIVFASTRGNVACMRNSINEQGSYFTQTLVQVITEADVDKNFLEIIREVARRVQEFQVQTVENQTTFTKEYYIKRFVYIKIPL